MNDRLMIAAMFSAADPDLQNKEALAYAGHLIAEELATRPKEVEPDEPNDAATLNETLELQGWKYHTPSDTYRKMAADGSVFAFDLDKTLKIDGVVQSGLNPLYMPGFANDIAITRHMGWAR